MIAQLCPFFKLDFIKKLHLAIVPALLLLVPHGFSVHKFVYVRCREKMRPIMKIARQVGEFMVK